MDIAGDIVIRQLALGRVTAVRVEGFNFFKPVNVSDVAYCYTHVTEVDTTPVTV